ncbi:jg8521 [Pararge aegeria aegeria]|uniref:Jg8521 protein n=1 Tax=Pararge aegeria aegeria TaxID=348720 RepID=A0A8S4RVX7_9NEOP|nr:jg8521 [Pararge aegeria aegeria]
MVQKKNDDCLLEVFSLLCDQKPNKRKHAAKGISNTLQFLPRPGNQTEIMIRARICYEYLQEVIKRAVLYASSAYNF